MRLALAALYLCACGGPAEVDIAGTYHLTTHQTSSACGGALQDSSLPSYAVLSAESGGYQALGYDDAALTIELPGISYEHLQFDTAIDNGWSGSSARAGTPSEGTQCALLYIKARATLVEPTLTIDLTIYNELGASPCTVEEAQRRGDSLPCVHDERFAGPRL